MRDYTANYSQLVMPDHINNIGTLFGGQMVSWMDLAAAKVAYRFLRDTGASGAVTRAIEKIEFSEPVFAGEWVNFTGCVIRVGKTSFTIRVEAYAESHEKGSRLACKADITMVAVRKDREGQYHKFPHGVAVE